MLRNLFSGDRRDGLDRVEDNVQMMIDLAHDEFDLALAALLGDRVADEVNDDLRAMDRKVNELEREIRRALLLHAVLFGETDAPAVLLHMSIVKDLERVGDYAKNLLDLARDGAKFGELGESGEWRRLAGEISTYIADSGSAFQSRDAPRSRRLHDQGDRLLRQFDERVSALVNGEDQRPQAVARAVAYRYLKRVVAHLMNLLSAVIMPLDRLDQFDEDPEDRES